MQFSQDDRLGWTHVESLGDDTCFTGIPLGFTFSGFGASTSTVSVSSNGVLFFGSGCNTAFSNTTLPTSISLDAMFFFWDDLEDFGGAEFFEYTTLGAIGGRVFNLYFHKRFHTGANETMNFMVSVHEGSNLVKASYSSIASTARGRGGFATFGLQTTGGGAATAFSVAFNSEILDDNANRQSMSFHPPR